jgi:hypothetical protein
MHIRTVLAAGAGAAATVVLAGGAAFAGEISGNGQFTPNHEFGHSHSICSFSGLEDGDGAGFPGPGGAPPQNWGHSKQLYGSTPAERKASGFQPGDSCNGHSGFFVNPPPGAP